MEGLRTWLSYRLLRLAYRLNPDMPSYIMHGAQEWATKQAADAFAKSQGRSR